VTTGLFTHQDSASKLRSTCALLIGLLPDSALTKAVLNRLCGWRIDPTARVGPCILVNIGSVDLAPHSRLGMSAFVNLRQLSLGQRSVVGHWNWITAAPELCTPHLASTPGVHLGELIVGEESSVTSRHYIDCSGGVSIGDFTVVAGVRSTVITHQVNTLRSEQELKAVAVGNYCLIGANTKIVPGAAIPDRCVVAMGSVVVGALGDEGRLYAGVPARPIKEILPGRYFSRPGGLVEIP
jgi:acetyltransferase-like isoleucine patch superfamily enzyme